MIAGWLTVVVQDRRAHGWSAGARRLLNKRCSGMAVGMGGVYHVASATPRYAAEFEPLFRAFAQRRGFREYLAVLLQPRDRDKTQTALAGAEPIVEALTAAVQRRWLKSSAFNSVRSAEKSPRRKPRPKEQPPTTGRQPTAYSLCRRSFLALASGLWRPVAAELGRSAARARNC